MGACYFLGHARQLTWVSQVLQLTGCHRTYSLAWSLRENSCGIASFFCGPWPDVEFCGGPWGGLLWVVHSVQSCSVKLQAVAPIHAASHLAGRQAFFVQGCVQGWGLALSQLAYDRLSHVLFVQEVFGLSPCCQAFTQRAVSSAFSPVLVECPLDLAVPVRWFGRQWCSYKPFTTMQAGVRRAFVQHYLAYAGLTLSYEIPSTLCGRALPKASSAGRPSSTRSRLSDDLTLVPLCPSCLPFAALSNQVLKTLARPCSCDTDGSHRPIFAAQSQPAHERRGTVPVTGLQSPDCRCRSSFSFPSQALRRSAGFLVVHLVLSFGYEGKLSIFPRHIVRLWSARSLGFSMSVRPFLRCRRLRLHAVTQQGACFCSRAHTANPSLLTCWPPRSRECTAPYQAQHYVDKKGLRRMGLSHPALHCVLSASLFQTTERPRLVEGSSGILGTPQPCHAGCFHFWCVAQSQPAHERRGTVPDARHVCSACLCTFFSSPSTHASRRPTRLLTDTEPFLANLLGVRTTFAWPMPLQPLVLTPRLDMCTCLQPGTVSQQGAGFCCCVLNVTPSQPNSTSILREVRAACSQSQLSHERMSTCPAGLTSPNAQWLSDTEALCRAMLLSWTAFATAALLALLLRGCRLQGGSCNADPALRAAREICGPHAHMCLAFAALSIQAADTLGVGCVLQRTHVQQLPAPARFKVLCKWMRGRTQRSRASDGSPSRLPTPAKTNQDWRVGLACSHEASKEMVGSPQSPFNAHADALVYRALRTSVLVVAVVRGLLFGLLCQPTYLGVACLAHLPWVCDAVPLLPNQDPATGVVFRDFSALSPRVMSHVADTAFHTATSDAVACDNDQRTEPGFYIQDINGLAVDGCLRLCTVLDGVPSQDRDTIYFHTWTLLEVLSEEGGQATARHPQQEASGHQSLTSTSAPKQQLQLEELLPPSPLQLAATQFRSLFDQEKDSLWHCSDPDLLDTVPLHATARELLRKTPARYAANPDFPSKVNIYTDGSAGRLAAAAHRDAPVAGAFAAFANDQEQERLLGYAAFQAATATSQFYIGESRADALESELLALTWAHVWAIALAHRGVQQVTFIFDCAAAGMGTAGSSKPARGDLDQQGMAALAVLLRQILSNLVELEYRHEHSHRGEAHNEFVDSIAKAVRAGHGPFVGRRPTWPASLAAHPLRDWLWLAITSAPDLPCLGALQTEASILQTKSPHVSPLPDRAKSPAAAGRETGPQLQVRVDALTANVLSLKDSCGPPEGLAVVGKQALLMQQLADRGVLFAGLQETRLRNTEARANARYWIFQSTCTPAGQYGCASGLAEMLRMPRVASRHCACSVITLLRCRPPRAIFG